MSKSARLDELMRSVERRDWAAVHELASRLGSGGCLSDCLAEASRERAMAGQAAGAEAADGARSKGDGEAEAVEAGSAEAEAVEAGSAEAEAVEAGGAEASGRVVLVTGAAGFIGSHLARRMVEDGDTVIGFDDFNDYYDPAWKFANLTDLLRHERFELCEGDVRELDALRTVFASWPITHIVHLAARAGVRPSLDDPQLYVTTNVLGTQNLLEMARQSRTAHFVYASSSSVYGGNTEFPFSEEQLVDHPVSPYAATKKANELQASCYGRLYGFPVTGLRFFTVYGPGGRPDMAIRMFIEAMERGEPVPMFGDGGFERDFTYVDDVVDGIVRALRTGEGQRGWDEVFNLGESDTTNVRELILLIAKELGVLPCERPIKDLSAGQTAELIEQLVQRGVVRRLPLQPGDVPKTYANIAKARSRLGYAPCTRIEDGIRKTVAWHRARRERGADPEREDLRRSTGAYAAARRRGGLDSLGQARDPAWEPAHADQLARALSAHFDQPWTAARSALAMRIAAGLAVCLAEAAAFLGGVSKRNTSSSPPTQGDAAPSRLYGLDGLAAHRGRKRIASLLRASAFGGLPRPTHEEGIALAKQVVARLGELPATLAIDATCYRCDESPPGAPRTHAGNTGGLPRAEEPIVGAIRQFVPYVQSVVVLTSEANDAQVRATLARSPVGHSPKLLVRFAAIGASGLDPAEGSRLFAGIEGLIVFSPACAPSCSPDVIADMMLLLQAVPEEVSAILPCSPCDASASRRAVLVLRGPDRGRLLGFASPAQCGLAKASRPIGIGVARARALALLALAPPPPPALAPVGPADADTQECQAQAGRPSSFDDWWDRLCGAGAEIAAPCWCTCGTPS